MPQEKWPSVPGEYAESAKANGRNAAPLDKKKS